MYLFKELDGIVSLAPENKNAHFKPGNQVPSICIQANVGYEETKPETSMTYRYHWLKMLCPVLIFQESYFVCFAV